MTFTNISLTYLSGNVLPPRSEPEGARHRCFPSRPVLHVFPPACHWDECGQRLPPVLPSEETEVAQTRLLQRRHYLHQVRGGHLYLKHPGKEVGTHTVRAQKKRWLWEGLYRNKPPKIFMSWRVEELHLSVHE